MVGLTVDSVSGSKLWLCISESPRKNPFAARGVRPGRLNKRPRELLRTVELGLRAVL